MIRQRTIIPMPVRRAAVRRAALATALVAALAAVIVGAVPPARAIIEWELETEKGGIRQPIWLEPFTFTGDAARLDPMARAGEAILVDDLFLSGYFRVDGPVAAALAPRGTEVARSKGPDLTTIVVGRLEPSGAGGGAKFVGRVLTHPAEKLIFEHDYPVAGEIRTVMHAFADDIVFHLTGEPGIARTRIACVCSASKAREVIVVDYDGHGARQLTRDNSAAFAPSWSPVDGLIAYASFKRGKADLYAVDSESGKGYDVSRHPGINSSPAWSPDGRFIAATLSMKDGNPDIYLIRRNGEIVDRLTFDPGIDTSPCFSPTGRQIAFVSDRLGTPQLFTMDGDGLNQTRFPIPQTYTDSPAWSPKGDALAYVAQVGGGVFDIFVASLPDAAVVKQLTFGHGSSENPRWAPDGRHIVFSSTRSGKRGVYVMLADGSNQRRLTPADRECFYPTWSPRPAAR